MTNIDELLLSTSFFVRNDDDIENLEQLHSYPIQLGIYSMDDSIVKGVKKKAFRENIQINSVHLPKITPDQGELFKYLQGELGANRFTVHPDSRTFTQAIYAWRPTLKYLNRAGIQIGFENMRNKRTWLTDPHAIIGYKDFKITLDVNHLPRMTDEVAAFNDLKDSIIIVHLTDKNSTGPYTRYAEFLPYAFQNPQKEYVLEYGRNHLQEMRRDYKTVQALFRQFCESASGTVNNR
jgi:hypothetical protein